MIKILPNTNTMKPENFKNCRGKKFHALVVTPGVEMKITVVIHYLLKRYKKALYVNDSDCLYYIIKSAN